MKLVARMVLEPGMVLGEPVFHRGVKLYDVGFTLDAKAIADLSRHSIMAVTVKEPSDFASTHFERIHLSDEFIKFDSDYKKYFPAYKSILYNFIEKGIPVDIGNLLKIYKLITANVPSLKNRLDFLANRLPSEDDITYEHCLNCAIICGVFGSWWHLTQEDLQTLILCGFYFDIGKLKLPEKLLWKTQKLTDFEFNWIKTHPNIGYDLIKNENLNEHIINATLFHHERCNGSGYPNHLLEPMIDPFAKMMAIVDSYDAMTCARSYRASLPTLDVIANFEKSGYSTYGMEFIMPIVQNLSITQLDAPVRLSDNSEGKITGISPLSYGKAIVTLNDGTVIDLGNTHDLRIIQYL